MRNEALTKVIELPELNVRFFFCWVGESKEEKSGGKESMQGITEYSVVGHFLALFVTLQINIRHLLQQNCSASCLDINMHAHDLHVLFETRQNSQKKTFSCVECLFFPSRESVIGQVFPFLSLSRSVFYRRSSFSLRRSSFSLHQFPPAPHESRIVSVSPSLFVA